MPGKKLLCSTQKQSWNSRQQDKVGDTTELRSKVHAGLSGQSVGGPEFSLPEFTGEKLDVVAHVCNPRDGEAE